MKNYIYVIFSMLQLICLISGMDATSSVVLICAIFDCANVEKLIAKNKITNDILIFFIINICFFYLE